MNHYISRAELYEISEGLINLYLKTKAKPVEYIDIDDFVTKFLNLNVRYASFAEDDKGKVGFLADGKTPLLTYGNGIIAAQTFPENTIVIDRYLLNDKENGKRRFTLAHEVSHYILNRMQKNETVASFNNGFDCERQYTKAELIQMFKSSEWQADAMAASLLMPIAFIERTKRKFYKSKNITIYGDNVFSSTDKVKLHQMANELKVSYTALVIRLRTLELVEVHDISEYLSKEFNLGGVL